jgi:hypothetical protein
MILKRREGGKQGPLTLFAAAGFEFGQTEIEVDQIQGGHPGYVETD